MDRYEVTEKVVIDHELSLEWSRHCFKDVAYTLASEFKEDGFRLPTIPELISVCDFHKSGFTLPSWWKTVGRFFTSTTYDTCGAFYVNMDTKSTHDWGLPFVAWDNVLSLGNARYVRELRS